MQVPLGFRFRPTDEQLVSYYLRPKVDKKGLPAGPVADCGLYGDKDPWEILDKDYKDYFYIFTKLKKRSKNRYDRRAGSGTWKGQNCKPIHDGQDNILWYKKDFVFVIDKDKKKNDQMDTGHWLMTEFSLNEEAVDVVCKIYNKHSKHSEEASVGVNKRKLGSEYENGFGVIPSSETHRNNNFEETNDGLLLKVLDNGDSTASMNQQAFKRMKLVSIENEAEFDSDTDLVPENYEATTTDQEQPNPHEFKYIHTNDDTMKFGNDEVEQQVTPYEFTSEEDDTNIADFDETISSKSNNNERIDIIEANAGEQQNNLADNFYFEFGEDDIMATPSLCNLDDNFYSDLPPLIELEEQDNDFTSTVPKLNTEEANAEGRQSNFAEYFCSGYRDDVIKTTWLYDLEEDKEFHFDPSRFMDSEERGTLTWETTTTTEQQISAANVTLLPNDVIKASEEEPQPNSLSGQLQLWN